MSMLNSITTVKHQNKEFEPSTELISEEDCDTLLLYLPGFKKHELQVQVSTNRKLRISGQKQQSSEEAGENRSRFHKEFQISQNCDTNRITAKFEGDILYITQPNIITSQTRNDNTKHENNNRELSNANPNTNPNSNSNPNNAKKKLQDVTNDEDVMYKKKQQSDNDDIIKHGKLTNDPTEELKKRRKVVIIVLSFSVLLLGIYATTWNVPADI